jgi:hypothetical protein
LPLRYGFAFLGKHVISTVHREFNESCKALAPYRTPASACG